ncbi:MAG: prepilin-type N-terminal cleavage/methylation domain-containing protein [Planctomycetes bacterium]|nr:prepilin-type N-terminal cleavage/methylation domain-containing protein [Planctomycetota bacterium]
MRRPRLTQGFTLIELVTAIAIFGILVGMLSQMIKGALDVWRMGEGGREALERASSLLEFIAADLRMLRADSAPGAGEAPVRLIADHGFYDLDLDQAEESVLQRLRFVRSCPEERFDSRVRLAGDHPGGTAAVSDTEQGGGQAELAPGGLAEIAYATLALPQVGRDPAPLTLYRLFRAPIGGEGSLFQGRLFDDPRRLCGAAVPLADNVLYLGFEFWSRDTLSWKDAPDSAGGRLTVWDSTRALLLDVEGFNRFLLGKGAASLEDGSDDVFPRRVRVTLVLERDEDEAATVRLAAAMTSTSNTLRPDTFKPFAGARPPHPFLKVEGEWMEWSQAAEGDVRVLRGARNTGRRAHAAGARLRFGQTFQRVVELPVFREDWNDP